MMAVREYIVTLQPMMPYFFGGEKNFSYGTNSNRGGGTSYFIESEMTPAQSTLFGLVRYMGIVEKKNNFQIDETVIGAESFTLERQQDFGCIKGISGLFIEQTSTGTYLMKTPLDHNVNEKHTYTPMTYDKWIATTMGGMLVPTEFEAKNGTASGYMSVETGELVSEEDIFLSDVQIKINKTKTEEAFFKKKYRMLRKGYRFAFSLQVTDGYPELTRQIVYMGQEKSPFLMQAREGTIVVNERLFDHVQGAAIVDGDKYVRRVAISDCYFGEQDMTEFSDMAYIRTRNHREFYTYYNKEKEARVSHLRRFHKRETLYHLIAAGSVFIIKKEKIDEFDHFDRNMDVKKEHLMVAGYNCMNGGKEA